MHANLKIERRQTPAPALPVLFADPVEQFAVVHVPTGYVFGYVPTEADAREAAERLPDIVPARILQIEQPGYDLAKCMKIHCGLLPGQVADLFREFRNGLRSARPTETPRTVESCLQPLLDRLPEPPSELEHRRLIECVSEFTPDEVSAAVEWHLREYRGDEFFISRLALTTAATAARHKCLAGRCA